MLVHWWMKLDFVPLMGNAVSRGVYIGIICFNKTLGNLSAGGWNYLENPTVATTLGKANPYPNSQKGLF